MKNNKLRRAVVEIGHCVLCGSTQALQCAHRNEGKGMASKVSDSLTACLCMPCHADIDNGKDMTREQRRALMDSAIVRTHEVLINKGVLVWTL